MASSSAFTLHLQRQLGFIRRSCEMYDKGERDEAIRIATSLRILIHQTSRSTSLLKHLNATTISLLSTAIEMPPGAVFHTGSMGRFIFYSHGFQYLPALDRSTDTNLFAVSKWWAQVVMILNGKKYTRKSIVLGASNQDGGAHVDALLDENYAEITMPAIAGIYVITHGGRRYEQPFLDTHLLTLRQMGYEILNSPAIVALSNA